MWHQTRLTQQTQQQQQTVCTAFAPPWGLQLCSAPAVEAELNLNVKVDPADEALGQAHDGADQGGLGEAFLVGLTLSAGKESLSWLAQPTGWAGAMGSACWGSCWCAEVSLLWMVCMKQLSAADCWGCAMLMLM
jgi:hypothetical protein